jgi:hypothetical protein
MSHRLRNSRTQKQLELLLLSFASVALSGTTTSPQVRTVQPFLTALIPKDPATENECLAEQKPSLWLLNPLTDTLKCYEVPTKEWECKDYQSLFVWYVLSTLTRYRYNGTDGASCVDPIATLTSAAECSLVEDRLWRENEVLEGSWRRVQEGASGHCFPSDWKSCLIVSFPL